MTCGKNGGGREAKLDENNNILFHFEHSLGHRECITWQIMTELYQLPSVYLFGKLESAPLVQCMALLGKLTIRFAVPVAKQTHPGDLC